MTPPQPHNHPPPCPHPPPTSSQRWWMLTTLSTIICLLLSALPLSNAWIGIAIEGFGNGTIARTLDSGSSWQVLLTNNSGNLYDLTTIGSGLGGALVVGGERDHPHSIDQCFNRSQRDHDLDPAGYSFHTQHCSLSEQQHHLTVRHRIQHPVDWHGSWQCWLHLQHRGWWPDMGSEHKHHGLHHSAGHQFCCICCSQSTVDWVCSRQCEAGVENIRWRDDVEHLTMDSQQPGCNL